MRATRWTGRTVQAACLLLALAALVRSEAQEGQTGAAPSSFRAAQDEGLNLSLRPIDLINADRGRATPGSFRAAQDIGLASPWTRFDQRSPAEGYQGPGAPPPWAGGKDRPLGSGAQRF
jgi:hypothetical protein